MKSRYLFAINLKCDPLNGQFDSVEMLARALGIEPSVECKVLSILGNTGEGKSYTLNEAIFAGKEIFPTSNMQESCTMGVRVAYQPTMQLVVLDTEGMLGLCQNENKRQRLLMKVRAFTFFFVALKDWAIH